MVDAPALREETKAWSYTFGECVMKTLSIQVLHAYTKES